MFKKCPMCNNTWNTREEFLTDEEVQLVGYQKYMGVYGGGYLLFRHKTKFCGTTIAVKASFLSNNISSTQRLKRIYKKEGEN
ncbi:MAG: hypothetical protein RMJ81_07485 [Candidatus Kryptonium sp.]|nr:hypothetical protein [Candidatus Kryptonium sp.]MDW8109477.1 hypothetical protein [Candidatus Kryptonium sp.]